MKNKLTKVISLLCVLTLTISIGIVPRLHDDPQPMRDDPQPMIANLGICMNM
jgi:hypothetical protein